MATIDEMKAADEAFENFLKHYGTPRHSGRYPYGSGEDSGQRGPDFLSRLDELKRKGMTDVDIAKSMGISTTTLREYRSVANAQLRAEKIATAQKLKDKQMSNVAIGKQMGIPESSVRALLNPSLKDKNDILESTSNMLKANLDEHGGFIDIGKGSEQLIGITDTKLKAAVSVLKDEGYQVFYYKQEQQGTGKETNIKVLAKPDAKFTDLTADPTQIRLINHFTEDGGRTYEPIMPPKSIDSKRVGVRWAEDGGTDKDGVIELRRGVDDISLGEARYAQVRIAVDGSHYLKGMAMYSDSLPDGVDMMFNTNKARSSNKLDAMKGMKEDPENPFGSTVRQKYYTDSNGKRQQSILNIVGSASHDGADTTHGEEGGWASWSKTLSSQMVSKQGTGLAKQQLDLAFQARKAEYDEISQLTNPAVKRKLLRELADSSDSAAVHLKAAGLPRTAAHVILPINSLKDNEVFAPKYNNGEKVVLIRHPHGGTFEIPELVVNNRNREANRLIPNAKDAIGINSKVAARLSGADFDGDTVLVIPNAARGNSRVKTSPPLAGLKNFDPQARYPAYDGMKTIDGGVVHIGADGRKKVEYGPKGPSGKGKGRQMGDVSNLITDMSLQGATQEELARAVRHSMVVIDSEKHSLNYKQSAIDNNISALKVKYQDGARKGAATLISRAKAETRVPEYKDRPAAQGGAIDPRTGKKMTVLTGAKYTDKSGKEVVKTIKSTKMAETHDAHSLVSKNGGTDMERIYAEHANKLKALANTARKDMVATKSIPYNPSAKKTYAKEVNTLTAKLNTALKNAPLERQAQIVAASNVAARKAANPGMSADDLKKARNQELVKARTRMGAGKQKIEITDREWEAIQAGAITNNRLEAILRNADGDAVKARATPRDRPPISAGKVAQGKALLSRGYTYAEVAKQLGITVSQLTNAVKK